MRKSNLENGMIVEWRDKTRYLVVGNLLLSEDAFEELETFNNELKDIEYKDERFDVMKVFKLKSIPENGLKDIFKDENLQLIWERKREIDWNKVPKFTPVLGGYFEGELKNAYFLAFDSMENDFPFLLTDMKDDEFTGLKHRHQNEFVCDICKIHPSIEIKEEWYK